MTDPGLAGFMPPAYWHSSLGEALPAVAAALGVPVAGDPGWALPLAPAYVVLLVDGLGAELLRRNAASAPYLSSLTSVGGQVTSGVPSTTAASLTSLGTGLPPGSHGVVGFTTRVPETGRLLNALHWDKTVDPLEWQPQPTLFERLCAANVDVQVVSKREFKGSGLSMASQRGAHFVGADRLGERISAVTKARSYRGRTRPRLVYVYEGDLDWIGHRYGVNSSQWRHQLVAIDAQAQQLRAALPAQTRLLILADHGMIDCPEAARVDVDQFSELREGLALLGGEARLRHLYAVEGAAGDLEMTWRQALGDRAVVLAREQAIALGWFGEVSERVSPRIGDVVVACRANNGVFSSVDFPGERRLVGVHGSLTRDEMLVPVLVD